MITPRWNSSHGTGMAFLRSIDINSMSATTDGSRALASGANKASQAGKIPLFMQY